MNRILLLTCPTFDPLRSALYLNGWLLKTEDLNYNDPAIESLFQSFQELPHTETRQRELEGDFDPDWTWPDHVDFEDYFPARNVWDCTGQELRNAGYAVIIWTPEELKSVPRRHLEDAVISHGNEFLESY